MIYKIFDNEGYIIDTVANEFGEQSAVIHLGSCSNGLNIAKSFYFAAYNESRDQLANMVDTGFRLYWDFLNDNVDEISLFDYDISYKTKQDTSRLTFKYDDGPIAVKFVQRYESYDVIIGHDPQSMFVFNVLFDPDTDSDSCSFERTLLITDQDNRVLFRLSFIAESEGEDERMTALLNNMNIKLDEEDCIIFREHDINEYRGDWQLLNKKRKELLATVNETQWYIGSFRSVINIIRFFGWEDVYIGEFWQDINPGSDNYRHIFKIDRYDVSIRKGDNRLNRDRVRHPNRNFKKTNRSALVYKVTEPNSKQDCFSDYLPYVDEVLKYPIEEVSVKLYKLRQKLNSEYMPVSNKFSDVIGECSYFTRVQLCHNTQQSCSMNIESGLHDIDFGVYPDKEIYITDDRTFFEDIYYNRHDENVYMTEYDNWKKKYEYDGLIGSEAIMNLKFRSIAELMDDDTTNTIEKLIKKIDNSPLVEGDNTYDIYDRFVKDSVPMEQESVPVKLTGENWITDAFDSDPLPLSTNNRKYAQAYVSYIERNGLTPYAGTENYPFLYKSKVDYHNDAEGDIIWAENDISSPFPEHGTSGRDMKVPISAKVILKYDISRFDHTNYEAQFTWDESDECQTWEEQDDNSEISELRWTIRHNSTGTVWIYSGNATTMNTLFLRLPYIGFYTVMLESTNAYGVVTRKVKEDYINVKPVNIDVTGIYQINPESNIDDGIYNEINHKETERTELALSDISDSDIYDAIPYYYSMSNNIENNKDISIALSPKHIWDKEPVIELKPFTRDMENILLERYMNSVYDMPITADMMTVFPSEPSCAFCPIPPVGHHGDTDKTGGVEISESILMSNSKPDELCDVIELELENGEIGYVRLEYADSGSDKDHIDWQKTINKLNAGTGTVLDRYYWSTVIIPTVIDVKAKTINDSMFKYWSKTSKGLFKANTTSGLSCIARYKSSRLDIKQLNIIPGCYAKYLKINSVDLSATTANLYSIKTCVFDIDYDIVVYDEYRKKYLDSNNEVRNMMADMMKACITFTDDNSIINFELKDDVFTVNGKVIELGVTKIPYSWYILILHNMLDYRVHNEEYNVTAYFKVNSSSVTEVSPMYSVSDLNKSCSRSTDTTIFNFIKGNPNSDTARLVHSHTMLYPFTWCILSVKNTKIAGIKSVVWNISNDYTDYSTDTDDDYKIVLNEINAKIIPVLFKQNGHYTVSVKITDYNGNEYDYSQRLITVNTYDCM